MTNSRTFRVLFVWSLVTATAAVMVIAGVMLWPKWRRYQAAKSLVDSVSIGKHSGALTEAVEHVAKVHGEALASKLLVVSMKEIDQNLRPNAVEALERTGREYFALCQAGN